MSLVFLFLSADEASQIHEKLDVLHTILEIETATTFLWTLPYSIIVLVLAIVYFRFLTRLPIPTKRLFVLSAIVFLSGAVGLELLAAALRQMQFDRFVSITVVLEEMLEMIGAAIFVYALVRHLADYGLTSDSGTKEQIGENSQGWNLESQGGL
ncbi:MAG: hypothetical protein ACR2QT_06020 [Woeseiaceae bacterium]